MRFESGGIKARLPQIGWNRGKYSRPYAFGIGMGVFIF